jgi:response regulator RpfG family c-di-GMP phosphodiesterase
MTCAETILIVNHDVHARSVMETLILGMRFSCLIASGAEEALMLLRSTVVDLIIAELDLPCLDGIRFTNRAREIVPESTFIILTGFSDEYAYSRLIKAGADEFLRKPYTQSEFKDKLRRIIGQIRLERENIALLREQATLNERLSTLLAISTDLTAELDVDRLFELIVGKVTDCMNAERSSLYVIDWDNREIWTKVAEQVHEIRLPLGQGISGRVAETGESVNIRDAWELPFFDRSFDERNRFRTKSVLCIPIRNQPGERIGVLQVINHRNENGFSREDEIFLKGLASQVGIALENSLLHEEVRLSFDRSILTLAATVDARHPLTAGHSERVTQYTLLIAREMNLTESELEVLKYAAQLHDIGKIGIRDTVLLKNGRFTDEERREMNSHPLKTRDILDNFHFPRTLKQVPAIAAHHHEKFNGEGYPFGVKGEDIPLGSRIMAVADVFDALTSPRDYPKYTGTETFDCHAMPLNRAVSILQADAGTHFDPEVVDRFLRCLPQALLLYRGTHFPPEYVDDILRQCAPSLVIEN